MDFDSFNADALSEATAIMGSSFIYKGATYSGIINDLESASLLIEGGLLETLVTIIVVQKCGLPTRPAVGETILSGGKTVRIERVKEDESSWELHCKTAAT
jgi:hypothetical protein